MECITPLTGLPPNSVVLDIGAGTGRQTLEIAKEELNVIAVDFAVNMLHELRREAVNYSLDNRITPVVADMVAQPFRDGVFDGIEMISVLHHIPSRQLRASALQEVNRVARRGGQAIVTVWFRGQRGFYRRLVRSAFNALLRRSEWGDMPIPWNKSPRFYHLFGKGELKSLLIESGFNVEAISVKPFGWNDTRGISSNVFLLASKT